MHCGPKTKIRNMSDLTADSTWSIVSRTSCFFVRLFVLRNLGAITEPIDQLKLSNYLNCIHKILREIYQWQL